MSILARMPGQRHIVAMDIHRDPEFGAGPFREPDVVEMGVGESTGYPWSLATCNWLWTGETFRSGQGFPPGLAADRFEPVALAPGPLDQTVEIDLFQSFTERC